MSKCEGLYCKHTAINKDLRMSKFAPTAYWNRNSKLYKKAFLISGFGFRILLSYMN